MSIVSKAAFLGSALLAKVFNRQRPLIVFFILTNRCNASCPYCVAQYYERYEKKVKHEMDTRQVKSILDQLAEMGTKRIGFSGGEPLLRKDIGEILAHATAKGINCGLNTNGFLVPSKIDDIRMVDNVTISLDGDQTMHDANRGQGTYCKARKGIEAVLQAGLPLHVSMVLNANNVDAIGPMLEMAKSMGFYLQISPMYYPIWGQRDTLDFPKALSHEALQNVLQSIIDYRHKGYPVFYSDKTYQHIINWPDQSHDRIRGTKPDFKYPQCHMGRLIFTVDANGDVYPCAALEAFPAQNALKTSVDEAVVHAQKHNCHTCNWACYNEYNRLLGLDRDVLLNTTLKALRPLRPKSSKQAFYDNAGRCIEKL